MLPYEIFGFVLGSEDRENRLFCWTRHFHCCLIIAIDIRKRRVVYSVTACKHEYLATYSDLIFQETSLELIEKISLKTFSIWGSCWWLEMTWAESANIIDKISSSQEFLLQHEIDQWVLTKECYRTFLKLKGEWAWTKCGHFQHLLWCLTAIN